MIEWSSILGLDIDEENNDDKKQINNNSKASKIC